MSYVIRIPLTPGKHIRGNFVSLSLPDGVTPDEAAFLARAWFTKHHPPRYEDPARFFGSGPTLERTEATEAFLREVALKLGEPKIPFVYPYSNTELPEEPAPIPAPADIDVANEVRGVSVPNTGPFKPIERLSRTQRLRRALFGGKRAPKRDKYGF